MTDEKELLSEKVKSFRQLEDMNQFEFAEDCGLSIETVSLIERGQANARLDTIQLLSSRMGITVSELFQHGNTKYIVIPGETRIDGELYVTYWIGAIQNGILVKSVSDIFTDLSKAKYLVLLCNEENLSVTHLLDIAEDAVT